MFNRNSNFFNRNSNFLNVAILLTVSAASSSASLKVRLRASAEGNPVGGNLTFTAQTEGQNANVWYSFRAARAGEPLRLIRDFSPEATIEWTSLEEGMYEFRMTARDRETGETSIDSHQVLFSSRVTTEPLISPTAHPMVFLYSAPQCAMGARMRVRMESEGAAPFGTPFKKCNAERSMNFYLAGMRAGSKVRVWHELRGANSEVAGPMLTLTVPAAPIDLPARELMKGAATSDGVLLHSGVFASPIATDLAGELVWYYPGFVSFITRVSGNGLFWGNTWVYGGTHEQQIVREFDLAGYTVRETNSAAINDQLTAMGLPLINSFHHEMITLPDGKILGLAGVEKMLDLDGKGSKNVLGDMIIVMDQDFRILWTWNAFDHLDIHRTAILGQTCAAGGCPPLFLARDAEDWVHGNAVTRTPDGNLLFSARHQDWLIKIDYRDTLGSGGVLWRLGKDGDFRFISDDPYPWFSHQHDGLFVTGDPTLLTVFDNGNTRRQRFDPEAHSRGQAIRLDEKNRTATLELNAGLGAYALAVGSAQRLSNGNYHFDLGWAPGASSWHLETDPAGNIVYGLRIGRQSYRSFRLPNLYSSADGEGVDAAAEFPSTDSGGGAGLGQGASLR